MHRILFAMFFFARPPPSPLPCCSLSLLHRWQFCKCVFNALILYAHCMNNFTSSDAVLIAHRIHNRKRSQTNRIAKLHQQQRDGEQTANKKANSRLPISMNVLALAENRICAFSKRFANY